MIDTIREMLSYPFLAARKRTVPLTPEPERRWAQKPQIVPGMARI